VNPASETATLNLPADAASVGAARRFAADVRWAGAEELADRLLLLVSEAATNAVLHARTPFSVSVKPAGRCIRVEVEDRSEELPTRKNLRETDPTGRGMLIIDALSSRWGIETRPGGKVVWFELEKDMA